MGWKKKNEQTIKNKVPSTTVFTCSWSEEFEQIFSNLTLAGLPLCCLIAAESPRYLTR